MKKCIVAVAALLATATAMSRPVTLLAHNQRSSSGTLATLKWSGCTDYTGSGSTATSCINPGNVNLANMGITPSTAVWDWDPATGILSMTGSFNTAATISSSGSAVAAAVIGDKVTDLVVNTGLSSTTAASYSCAEGNFLATVGASGCLNINLGEDTVLASSAVYNVGGDANCVKRSIGGDDVSTGNVRTLASTAGNGISCDPGNGAFNLWTVVRDDAVAGGTLILSNGVPTDSPGTNYLTFQYVAGPVATKDDASTQANTPVVIDVLANDSGFTDPVTVAVAAGPSHGSVAITGSPGPQAGIALTYTPAAGFRGTDSFQYSVTDGVASAAATVTVQVGVKPQYYPSGPQTDVALTTVTGGGWKQCYVATMATSIGPNAENVLSACKGGYLMMAGRATGSSSFLVLAAAPYADAILNTNGGNNTHLVNGSSWYFTPSLSWGFTAANDTVNLNTCDYGGSSPTSMCLHTAYIGGYRINDIVDLNNSTAYEKVFFVDQVPGAYADAATTYLPKPVDIHVMSNDAGFANPTTLSVTTQPQHGTAVVNGSPGNPALLYVTYTPDAGYQGADSFVYSADDGALSGSATVTVDVKAPQANPDTALAKLGNTVSIDVLANDTGFSDPVTVTLSTGPAHGTATVAGSPGNAAGIRINYTAAAGYTGPDSFQYQVGDGVNSATATVSITVSAFKAVDDSYTVLAYDSPYLYVGLNDVGFQDPVSLTILSGPGQGSAHTHNTPGARSDVVIHFFPDYYSNYTTTMTYQMSDGIHTDTATVNIRVVTYLAQDDQATVGSGGSATISVTQNDLGFDSPRTLGIYTNPQHGTVVPNNPPGCCTEPSLTYAANPGFVGDDTFQYAIDDGTRIGIATVTVHVVNDQDNDLVNDDFDNCLGVANANQRDTDGDGYGNMCDADLNNDGRVNFADLALFRASFGTTDPNSDLDGSGVVNFADLARFSALFGKAPGPSALHR